MRDWVHGLKLAPVAVVAAAVLAMWRSLAPDLARSLAALAGALASLLLSSPFTQVGIIVVGWLLGLALLAGSRAPSMTVEPAPAGRRFAIASLVLFGTLLLGLPPVRAATSDQGVALIDSFYHAGSLVFGGDHVVLPPLHESVVPSGWVTEDRFLAGYAAAQAVHGPLFTFAAYLGAVMGPQPNGVAGAVIAVVAILLPSFLLIWAALPFWHQLRRSVGVSRALAGTNASVVGILLAALYTPIGTSAIARPADAVLALGALALLALTKTPPWVVVLLSALGGKLFARLG